MVQLWQLDFAIKIDPMFGKIKKKIKGTVILLITLKSITLLTVLINLIFLLSTH